MGFTLEEVVPWGRSFEEYVAMFALSGEDLGKKIVGCGDGPAAFNAELARLGGRVVSIDPVYRFTAEEIADRIDAVFETVMAQTRENANEFVWSHIRSVEELGRLRMKSMRQFLDDYEFGKAEGRYLHAELPELPIRDGRFDIALCSHFLFLYSEHLDLEFHIQSLRELCRVAKEVRVFPLLELGAVCSRHLDEVLGRLAAEGYRVKINRVDYEFQRGGDEMLRLVSPQGLRKNSVGFPTD